MESGALVSDEIILGVVREELDKPEISLPADSGFGS